MQLMGQGPGHCSTQELSLENGCHGGVLAPCTAVCHVHFTCLQHVLQVQCSRLWSAGDEVCFVKDGTIVYAISSNGELST